MCWIITIKNKSRQSSHHLQPALADRAVLDLVAGIAKGCEGLVLRIVDQHITFCKKKNAARQSRHGRRLLFVVMSAQSQLQCRLEFFQ